MTLTNTTIRNDYNGDGSQVVFPVDFVFWDDDDLRLVLLDANGNEMTWTRGTQYTVAGGGGGLGSVTVNTSPTDYTPQVGERLTIISNLENVQNTSLPLGGEFPSTTVERELDQTVRRIQQVDESIGRTITLPVTSQGVSAELPGAIANAVLGWSADGSALENKTPNDGTVLPALLGSLTTAEITQLLNINATTISAAQWGYLGAMTAQPLEAFTEADGRTPVGAWLPFGGQNLAGNWLFANGQNVSRSQWPDLFARYGTIYGAGDGSTSFGLPDLRGRVIAGLDGMGGFPGGNRLAAVLNSTVLGATGGNQVHALTQAQLAPHGHNVNFTRFDPQPPSVSNNPAVGDWTVESSDNPPNTTDTSVTGNGQPHLNVQPTMVGNIVIFAGQEVPQ